MGALNRSSIEAACGKNYDLRNVLLGLLDNDTHLATVAGTNLGQPAGNNGSLNPISQPPGVPGISVTGANGSFVITLTAPSGAKGTVFYEVSLSTASNFTTGVTTLPLTSSTQTTYPAPGGTYYWRVRATYDKTTFSAYGSAGGAINAGLQSSAATEPAVSLNQTNYAIVDSVPNGPNTNVRIYGLSGPGTNWVSITGKKETVLPSATIINTAPNSDKFIGYDGEQFLVQSQLSQVFPDQILPVGKVGTASTTAPTLPTVSPIINGSGNIIGYNVLTPGANLTGTLIFTIADTGGGTGATTGAQVITGGQLISLSAGNPGAGYTGATTVIASGGLSPGSSGGGGPESNNGGRYVPNI